jgi:atlastin
MDEKELAENRPIPILVPKERSVEAPQPHESSCAFTLNEKALLNVLLQDHIKDRIAAVVSVAGTFRKGKSFLLDFFLRYLNFTVRVILVSEWLVRLFNSQIFPFILQYSLPSKKPTSKSWLGDEHTPLEGFSWRGGSQADTTGILMWSEIFCTVLPEGEKVSTGIRRSSPLQR